MSEKQFNKSLKRIGTTEDMKNIVLWFMTKESMSPLKLTCLCYFAFAWGLVFFKAKIAPFRFFKKDDILYEKTLCKIWNNEEKIYRTTLIPPELPDDIKNLLYMIWKEYGTLDDKTLLGRIRNQAPFIYSIKDIPANKLMLFFCIVAGK